MAGGCSCRAVITFTLLASLGTEHTAARPVGAPSAASQSARATGSGLMPGNACSLPLLLPP
eukprot:9959023-Alexandrium_andersonii.AAC.1